MSTQMAGQKDLNFHFASIVNVSGSLTVKLTGRSNYHQYRLWKKQMTCLMGVHKMRGIVDPTLMARLHQVQIFERDTNCWQKVGCLRPLVTMFFMLSAPMMMHRPNVFGTNYYPFFIQQGRPDSLD
uniref:uncharacterized protein LOC122598812 n=1 Tax=Erigeron canadensis TaxID=72917 RepID=UPI001CB941C0|nr:uncharacterized protein LOC122598812 [Erigeron canadensis]